MSEPQHEQLSALLDTIYQGFTTAVAASRGKSVAEVGGSHMCCCAESLHVIARSCAGHAYDQQVPGDGHTPSSGDLHAPQ